MSSGADQLTVYVSDNGYTGEGGALTASAAVEIVVVL